MRVSGPEHAAAPARTARPAVSVVMPAFNVAAYVEEAVASALAQTVRHFELIAVDDGSDDDTATILERLAAADPRIGVLRQRSRGAAGARNTGVAAAAAPLVAFLDGDDRWAATLLERTIGAFERDPKVDLVFPWYRHIDAEGNETGTRGKTRAERLGFREVFLSNPIHSCTGVMVRRDAIRRVGGFDEQLTSNVDFDLWLRIAALRSDNLFCVHETLADYRRRPGQLTASWRCMAENWERVLVKARAAAPETVTCLEDVARANKYVYFSRLASREGDAAGARRLIAFAWRAAPGAMLGSMNAYTATIGAVATVLPASVQRAVARWMRAS